MTKRIDRRDSAEEIEQLFNIKQIFRSFAEKNNLSLDLSNYNRISRGVNAMYLAKDGEFYKSAIRKRNKFYDSKTFDAFIEIGNFLKKINLFFFCKSTLASGGTQDNICAEIGEFITNIKTRNNLYQNSDEFYILLLDGNYWEESNIDDMQLPYNVIVCNSKNFEKKIDKIFKNIL